MEKDLFYSYKFAHRGLFNNQDIPENSLKAFARAVEHGYGIELDVYVTKSGDLIVHHDYLLRRSAGKTKKALSLKKEELSNYKLFGTEETIPTLEEALAVISGKVPLIVEIKCLSNHAETAGKVAEAMKAYDGPYCIESFNYNVIEWFYKNEPEITRGLLSPFHFVRIRKDTPLKKSLRFLEMCKPDFLAYNIKEIPNPYLEEALRRYPQMDLVTWTVRTPEQMRQAEDLGAAIIFEETALK